MRFNPLKCAFGVASGKFLGYIVNQRRIEANPEKIKALVKMKSPRRPKDVQCLTERMAAFSRFVSKSTDKCLPFFNISKGANRFEWTAECKTTFQALKEHLGHAPLLSKPRIGEAMLLYLAISAESFDIIYKPRATIKGQALADFVAEFSSTTDVEVLMTSAEPSTWHLFFDGSSRDMRPYYLACA
ncbi:Retrovirus-related Pol polyprotein from transposon [Abeliophyllum distichum]|uniref:Retrovirus-related Pol polyprotein from transposon n=1 Tax=Abeliophyllum distichum TaxID=126358 RepID=A0ABD1RWF8_9LAMI